MSLRLSSFVSPLLPHLSTGLPLLEPVLVWEAGPREADPASLRESTGEVTLPLLGSDPGRPEPGDPLVFPVKKGGQAGNALAIGITFGRTPNNDLCILDESVSRFHGYFRRDEKSDLWTVVDVGSKNGTLAGGVKLETDKPHYLDAREELTIGGVKLLFLVPETLLVYLQGLTARPAR